MITVIKHFSSFNPRRYSDPWVALVGPDGKPDFSERCGDYTGNRGAGEEGDLYITDPVEGAIYMYGQKDLRGNNTERAYAQYKDGEFQELSRADVIFYFDHLKDEAKAEEKSDAADGLSIKDIADRSGRSLLAVSKELGINYRTILRWSTGDTEAPQYVLRLIAEHYGLIKIVPATE